MKASKLTKAAAAGVTLALAAPAYGQHAQQEAPPTISVTATGSVQVTPDRARIQVGVETEASSAVEASAENNRKQTAVLAAIRGLGIQQRKITTLNYSVSPIQRWNEAQKKTEIVGYRVSNIVQVDADKVEQVGPIIDAGLKAGANRVASLDFRVSNQEEYRDSALTLAVQSARRQAEVAAKAAGGVVADLMDVSIVETGRPEPRVMMMAAKASSDEFAPTPVSEGSMTVSVIVSTRWKYEKR